MASSSSKSLDTPEVPVTPPASPAPSVDEGTPAPGGQPIIVEEVSVAQSQQGITPTF